MYLQFLSSLWTLSHRRRRISNLLLVLQWQWEISFNPSRFFSSNCNNTRPHPSGWEDFQDFLKIFCSAAHFFQILPNS